MTASDLFHDFMYSDTRRTGIEAILPESLIMLETNALSHWFRLHQCEHHTRGLGAYDGQLQPYYASVTVRSFGIEVINSSYGFHMLCGTSSRDN